LKINRIFHLGAALILGASLSISFFAVFLQRFGGALPRVLAILISLLAVFGYFSYSVIEKYILPGLRSLPFWAKMGYVAGSLVVGAVLIASFSLQPESIHFLFPRHRLEIIPLDFTNPASSGREINIHFLADGETFLVNLKEFQFSRDWQISRGMLSPVVDHASPAVWEGSLLNRGRLAIESGQNAGMIRVIWDGEAQDVDLYSTGDMLKYIKLPVNNPPAQPFRLLAWGSYQISLSFLFLFIIISLSHLPARELQSKNTNRRLLGYALPMVLVWTIYLLVFYPGILSSDSIHQWRMITGLEPISDWHPAIHTLMMWLLTRIWASPAVVAVVQIVTLSLVAAWGIRGLEEWGLPRWGAWLMSLLFAISPVNSTMVITPWKDIPYAISLFALFLIIFRVVLSEGSWMDRPWRWVSLGLVGAAAGLFRHNGVAVVSVILLVMLVVYRRHWKPLLKGVGLFILVWAVVTGPVYSLAKVVRMSDTLRDTIYLHHFGAHVVAGTPLTDEEREYFNALKPITEWKYYCCNVSPLFYDPDFNGELFKANRSKHLRIFLDLALRDPKVEVQHLLCSSSLVWKICNDCGFLAHAILTVDGKYQWVDPNPLGLKEASLLPGLVTPLAALSVMLSLPPWVAWVWGPAIYLYLALTMVMVFALWRKSWKMLLIGLPALVQSAILAVINISTDFRYQYSVYLMGVFCIGLLIMMASKPKKK
jgi:hypothetical protein